MPIAGYLSDRMPARNLIVTGILMFMASAFAMTTVGVDTSFAMMVSTVALGRVALALVNPPLNVSAISALPPAMLGQGAGLINFARQLGGAFGVSGLAMALDWRMAFHSDALTAAASTSSAAADLLRDIRALLAAAGQPADLQSAGALRFFGDVIAAQAYANAFQDAFYLVGIVLVIALAPAMVLRGRKPRHVEAAPVTAIAGSDS